MKSKILFISLAMVLVLSISLIGCAGPVTPEEPTCIKIVAVRSYSGPLSEIEKTAAGPQEKYWEYTVNNVSGGIYVPEFGKTLKVCIDKVDDQSDMDLLISKLSEKLATGDYIAAIGPCYTAGLQAVGGVATTYKTPLIGQEGGGATILDALAMYPYLFLGLNFVNWNQGYELCRLLDSFAAQLGRNITLYLTYINDLHGYEYKDFFLDEVAKPGHNITIVAPPVGLDFGATDVVSTLITANATGADAFFYFGYPPTNLALVSTACSLGINFKVMGFSLYYAEAWFDPRSGGQGKVLDGVIGCGGWNEYSSPALGNHTKNMVDFFAGAGGRMNMDWWGVFHFANLQMLQQAIAAAPQYTAESLRATLASHKFTTVLGQTWYTDYTGTWPLGMSGGVIAKDCHPGEVMQWQMVYQANSWRHNPPSGNWTARTKPYGIPAGATCWGIHEVISLDHPTAPPIFPKPDWAIGCSGNDSCMGIGP